MATLQNAIENSIYFKALKNELKQAPSELSCDFLVSFLLAVDVKIGAGFRDFFRCNVLKKILFNSEEIWFLHCNILCEQQRQ